MNEQRAAKAALRRVLGSRRRARGADDLALATAALNEQARRCDAQVVAAFVPVSGEPGDLTTLEILRDRRRVLLPVVEPGSRELGWAEYAGPDTLVRGPLGLLQPPASDPALSLHDVEVVLAPAVALTERGERLGHGGGFYDRALRGIPTDRIVGVVHDDEVVDELPVESHDLRVRWLLTPSGLRGATG